MFRRELKHLARQRGAKLWIITGRRTDLGEDPLAPGALITNIPDLARHDIYLCGPPGMTAAVTRALRAVRVPRRQIHHESFEF